MTAPDTGCEQVESAVDHDQQDDEIIVTVRQGPDETARWWLQRPQSDWQIAQIAEDLEDHLARLVEADDQRKDTQ
ncbi:MAG: hypothetical protein F4X58_04495 [Chloroflexi bacterium]|nr:hypothetical protein [Chloroflexota bacterium]